MMTQPSAIPPPPASPPPSSSQASSQATTPRARAPKGPGKPVSGPRPIPLIANVFAMKKQGLLNFFLEAQRDHGPIFSFFIARQRMVVVSTPNAVQQVLATNANNYFKGNVYDGLRKLLGRGLITIEQEGWHKRRMMIQPSFHRETLGALVDVMLDSMQKFFEDLRKRYPEGGTIDAHTEMVQLTLDVVITSLFGRDLLESSEIPYEALNEILPLINDRSSQIHLPDFIPTPDNLRYKRMLRELDDTIYKILRVARAKEHVSGPLLSMLLNAIDEDTGAPLTDADIRDELIGFFIAGHETTALALTWLFVLLDGEDDVMQRVRDEVQDVVGDRQPTYSDVPQLIYTRQVIDEALRLRGPAALVARNAAADDNLDGYQIRKGDIVVPFFYGLHRHPDFWPDADRFDPDRFSEEEKKGRNLWSYTPFSAGSRVCVGNTFSLVESVIILAMFSQKCRFSLNPNQKIEPTLMSTLRPSNPVMVDLKWR